MVVVVRTFWFVVQNVEGHGISALLDARLERVDDFVLAGRLLASELDVVEQALLFAASHRHRLHDDRRRLGK